MKITISQNQSFLICDESGDVLPATEQGLYYLDTRFLSAYQLYVNNVKPSVLTGKEVGYFSSIHYLAVPPMESIKPSIRPETIIISKERYVDKYGLHERITITNYNDFKVPLSLLLRFDNDFADIFEVKAIHRPIKLRPRFKVSQKRIIITHQTEDFFRETRMNFSQNFSYENKIATFDVELDPKGCWECNIDFLTLDQKMTIKSRLAGSSEKSCSGIPMIKATSREVSQEWLGNTASFKSDYALLTDAYNQSIRDLEALRLKDFAGSGEVPAAGIPWYTTAFGRDSLITSYQTLLIQPALSEGTLKVLAKYQGQEEDDFTEEQPGKIIHEIRFGRLAAKKTTPHAHYFGTVDATPLFIILAEQYYRWTGDRKLIDELKPNIISALEWIDKYGDLDGDGFVEYNRLNPKGIYNQGWKDSGDSTHFADGTQAEAPIALAELQGYVYSAKKRAARLFELWGDRARASALWVEAGNLKKRFNEAFWMEDKGYYAMGLDKDKRQIDSITSNGVHLLWTKIADVEKAEIAAKRSLEKDMFSGWGIRTLSSLEKRYNPASYHNGSIWPHDNSIIMVGFLKYGLEKEAAMILQALIDVSKHFPHRRLPELFCGFDQALTSVPIAYPTSSSPQAWASASIPYMAFSLLRARPDVEKKKITIAPFLLPSMNTAFYGKIKFAGGNVSLKVERTESTPLPIVSEKPDWVVIEELK